MQGIAEVCAAIARGPLLAGIICVLNAYSMLDRYREAMLDLLRGHGRSGQE